MIVIDSSAVVTILRHEPGYEEYVAAVELADACLVSAANYLECAIVIIGRTSDRDDLDAWVDRFRVNVVPVDLVQARLAADAFARYGRGRHPAQLNYGDCFAYALASSRDAPLLYKGSDFDQTDLRSALTAQG